MNTSPRPSIRFDPPGNMFSNRTLSEITYTQDSTPTRPLLMSRNGIRAEELRARLVAASESSATTYQGLRSYKKVVVKMFVWEDDEFDETAQLDALANVFRTHYGYITDRCIIPLAGRDFDANGFVGQEFLDGLKKVDRDSLLIIYYCGHATSLAGPSGAECIWGAGNRRAIYVNFTECQAALRYAQNVLYLLDACYATTAASRNVHPVLASSAIEAKSFGYRADLPERWTFTMGLTHLLREAAESKQYHNVISLHAALVRMALRDRIASTPVYTACPLIPVSQPEVQRRYVTSLLPVQPVLTGANACYIPPQNLKWTHTDSVTVKLVAHINDPTKSTISEFAAWVQAHPKSIGRLGIDSVRFGPLIPGGSAYLVVDMAVALWDCLESHPAITFLGFNDDSTANAVNATVLAIRAADEIRTTPGEHTASGSSTGPGPSVLRDTTNRDVDRYRGRGGYRGGASGGYRGGVSGGNGPKRNE